MITELKFALDAYYQEHLLRISALKMHPRTEWVVLMAAGVESNISNGDIMHPTVFGIPIRCSGEVPENEIWFTDPADEVIQKVVLK